MKVAVVGGGLAGLSLGALLAQRGEDVTVFEARAWGGKMGRLRVAREVFSTGPSLFTFPEVWRLFLDRLREPDPLRLRPLDGLGLHHTPYGALALPVPIAHPLRGEWERYRALVCPLRPVLVTLLTTPPCLSDPAFVRASAVLGRALGPHLSAASWIATRHFSPPLRHALLTHALNAGLPPQRAPALYALLPALIAQDVYRPEAGMYALVEALLHFCRARGVTLRREAVSALDERGGVWVKEKLFSFDRVVSALDPYRLAALRGKPAPTGLRTVSGVAMYAAFEEPLSLPQTSILPPADFDLFARQWRRGDWQDTLQLAHARGRGLALLLSAPANGLAPSEGWVASQLRRFERTVGAPGLLSRAQCTRLTPAHYAALGTLGGAIYGQAYPLWRAGPFHPQPYRLSPNLWQVGAGVHPGGGVPAVLGGALMVSRLLR